MGIDIFTQWDGQTEAETGAQHEALFSVESGRLGYLREAYHGEPYATQYLVPEAFAVPDGVAIPAAVLRERLAETLRLAELRQRQVYGATTEAEIEPIRRSFIDFVELCERIEARTGKPVTVVASY